MYMIYVVHLHVNGHNTYIYIHTHIKFLIYLLISVTGARILLPNHNYTQYIYEHSHYCTQVHCSILDSIPDTTKLHIVGNSAYTIGNVETHDSCFLCKSSCIQSNLPNITTTT